MHDIEENKAVVLKYLQTQAEEGLVSAGQLTTPDARWWIEGDWQLGGTYSLQELCEALAPIVKDFKALSFEIHNVTAEANRVSVDMTAHGTMTDGRKYNNTYHMLFFIEHGKIRFIKEFTDTLYARSFFYPSVGAGAPS
jgi:ketosteroid isomerase-like protein